MMRAASESLGYFIDNFGPYPHPHLRLVEVPAQYQSFSGFAQPGAIFLGENRGFLIDAPQYAAGSTSSIGAWRTKWRINGGATNSWPRTVRAPRSLSNRSRNTPRS